MTPAQPAPVDHEAARIDAAHLSDTGAFGYPDNDAIANLARAYLSLRAENEAQRAGVLQMTRYLAEANARAEAAEATAARLREALERFGQHDRDCNPKFHHNPDLPCTCGLSAALEGAKG